MTLPVHTGACPVAVAPNGYAILLRTNVLAARGARTTQADAVSSNRLLDSFRSEKPEHLLLLGFQLQSR